MDLGVLVCGYATWLVFALRVKLDAETWLREKTQKITKENKHMQHVKNESFEADEAVVLMLICFGISWVVARAAGVVTVCIEISVVVCGEAKISSVRRNLRKTQRCERT